jgi:hypothetical protein
MNPEESAELFKKMREAVETGNVPESPGHEATLIADAKKSAQAKRHFQTGSGAMADWQKKMEDQEDKRREER